LAILVFDAVGQIARARFCLPLAMIDSAARGACPLSTIPVVKGKNRGEASWQEGEET